MFRSAPEQGFLIGNRGGAGLVREEACLRRVRGGKQRLLLPVSRRGRLGGAEARAGAGGPLLVGGLVEN